MCYLMLIKLILEDNFMYMSQNFISLIHIFLLAKIILLIII